MIFFDNLIIVTALLDKYRMNENDIKIAINLLLG